MSGLLNHFLGGEKAKASTVLYPESVEVGPWERQANALVKTFEYSEGAELTLHAQIAIQTSSQRGLTQRSISFTVSPGVGLNGPARLMLANKKTGRGDGWLDVRAKTGDDDQTHIEVYTRAASDQIFSALCREASYDLSLADGRRTIARLVIPNEEGLMSTYEALRSQLVGQ